MSDFQLDKVDIDILRELQSDSRLSVRELAVRVHRWQRRYSSVCAASRVRV